MRQRLRAILQNAALLLGSVVFALLALEALLRFMPVAWAPAVVPPDAANPILRYAPNSPFTWSLGWNFYKVVHARTNAQGFVADYDYDAASSVPLVAVVGDSFIEAMQVPYSASVTGLLQKMLGGRGRAYAIAQSGAALSQYVANAQHACERYHPQRLVVSVVGNDFDESIYEHRQRDGLFNLHRRGDGVLDWRLTPLPPATFWEEVARHSALALYLARNVGISRVIASFGATPAKAATSGWVGNTAARADPARVKEGFEVIDWFLQALPPHACLPPEKITITVDAARPEIYSNAAALAARDSYFGRMRARLLKKAAASGFRTVDLETAFQRAFWRDGKRFENPTDNHWNETGHATVAAMLRETLSDWPPLAPPAR